MVVTPDDPGVVDPAGVDGLFMCMCLYVYVFICVCVYACEFVCLFISLVS